MPPATPTRAWKYFIRSSDSKSATYALCDQRFVYKGATSNLLNHLNYSQHPSTTVKGADRFVFLLKTGVINTCLKRIYTKSFWLIEGQAIIYMTEIIAWLIL